MTLQIHLKKGDLILYDKFGTLQETVSPTTYLDDFGVGIIIDIIEENPGGEDNSYARVMKDDGKIGFYSLSYINHIDFQLSLHR